MAGIISEPRVRTAMVNVDRRSYVKQEATAYADAPQQIGWNITISAPHMHARALHELRDHLQPGCKERNIVTWQSAHKHVRTTCTSD